MGGGGICTVPVHDCLEGGGSGMGVFSVPHVGLI